MSSDELCGKPLISSIAVRSGKAILYYCLCTADPIKRSYRGASFEAGDTLPE